MARKKGNNYIIDEENKIVKIELRRKKKENLWTIIDLDDFDRVIKNFGYTWFSDYNKVRNLFYVKTCIYLGMSKNGNGKYKCILLHKFILNYFGKNKIDHINHDTLDNRKCNLRIVENESNTQNRKGKNKNNKSGYRNVSKSGNTWIVQLQVNGKNTILGRFPLGKLDEAAQFAEEMRQKYYGEYAGEA